MRLIRQEFEDHIEKMVGKCSFKSESTIEKEELAWKRKKSLILEKLYR